MKFNTVAAFTTGIGLSVVAAYYSIIGLTSIFAGAFWSIVVMGSVLEMAKLVSVSWLYQNWEIASKSIKSYFFSAIVILMLITSMGIFGFLSKSHFEQTLPTDTQIAEIAYIQQEIDREKELIDQYEQNIKQMNSIISTLIQSQRIRGSGGAIETRDKQIDERQELEKNIRNIRNRIKDMEKTKFDLSNSIRVMESELGPIKYISNMIYGDNDKNHIDGAVRIVIIMLIFVFDPLAVVLLLASNISFTTSRKNFGIEYLEIKNIQPKKKKKNIDKTNTM